MRVAFIESPSRARELIFGRPLLERIMLVCERVGVRRFFISAADSERAALRAAMEQRHIAAPQIGEAVAKRSPLIFID